MTRAFNPLSRRRRTRAVLTLAALPLLAVAGFSGVTSARENNSESSVLIQNPAGATWALPVWRAQLDLPANADLRAFYGARGDRPLWVADGALLPATRTVAELVATADLDGLDPQEVGATRLEQALHAAKAQPAPLTLARAELELSRSFAAYVRLTRRTMDGAMLYEHVSLQPHVPSVARALWEAAEAPSLADYVTQMRWLHPLYAPLRQAVLGEGGEKGGADGVSDPAMRRLAMTNLARIRALPAVPPGGRYVLVNAAAARLWMYEGDRPVDSMKVVVGKVDNQTPVMSGYIRYAILNPYWNVPPDFTRARIAGKVLRQGARYLRRGGYEVMSDWTADAVPVAPTTVDWRAVASGAVDLRLRQLPGPGNSMGQVKFEFPNQLGIYLHDTPQTALMQEEARQFSSGCVRLEDAPRLGRWLFAGPMPTATATEHRVDLPALVPVYITYLTLQPEPDGRLTRLDDPYGRDRAEAPVLALQAGGQATER